jgi:multimeric flavodoxin WrbA
VKIVGIFSSPSYNGNTAVLVREALTAAQECSATIEEIFLPGYDLQFCKGCMHCLAEGFCPIPDDLEDIRHSVYDCDGIVIGSPAYRMAPNARMKNFFDRFRMYTAYTSSLAGKHVVGISTASAVGANKVAKHLTEIVEGIFGSGYVSGTLGVHRGDVRIEKKPEALAQARRLGMRLVKDIEKGQTYPFRNLANKILITLILRKVMRRNILENRKNGMKAVYENLTIRGLLKPIE